MLKILLFLPGSQYPQLPFRELHDNGASHETADSSQETGTRVEYQNLTADGEPIPGRSRGIVSYQNDYMNLRPARNSLYDKLQLISRVAIEWLRNLLGNVDESGRHVYDVMERDQHVFAPYDKITAPQMDPTESEVEESNDLYDTIDRSPTVVLPTRFENISVT